MKEISDLIQSLIGQVLQFQDEFSDEELAQIFQVLNQAVQYVEQQREQIEAQPSPRETPEVQGEPSTREEAPTAPIEPEQVPPLQNAPYPSSNIHAFRYDPESQKLWVKFQGKEVADAGPTYSYEGVPKYIFDVLRRGAVAPRTSGRNRWHRWREGITPSHGAAMFALIKEAGFPYQRVA